MQRCLRRWIFCKNTQLKLEMRIASEEICERVERVNSKNFHNKSRFSVPFIQLFKGSPTNWGNAEGHWRPGKTRKKWTPPTGTSQSMRRLSAVLATPLRMHTHFGKRSKKRAVSTSIVQLEFDELLWQRQSLLPSHCISSLKLKRAKTSPYCRFESCRQRA